MRLFFTNMNRHWGGQSYVVMQLADHLSRRGHEVVVAGVAGSELVERGRKRGLRVFDKLELRRGLRLGSFLRDQASLKAFWKEFQPEGILTNGSQDTWACGLARWRFRTPAFLVRWRHNSFKVSAHVFNKWLYRSLIDHVAVSSMEIAPLLIEPGLVPAERVTAFPPTADLERFLEAKPTGVLRKELGIGEKDLAAVAVGRLAPEKAHDTLIRAWKQVVAQVPNAYLAIAGLGSQEQMLRGLIGELGLEKNVRLLGFRDDVPLLYADADLAALTPVAGESFGIALLEALASGKPCVATDVGGVKDLVRDGETGFLVKAGDSDAIAAALLKLLTQAELRERMGRSGRTHAQQSFSANRLADTAEALFQRLHADRKAR